jgi:hypothetical protein
MGQIVCSETSLDLGRASELAETGQVENSMRVVIISIGFILGGKGGDRDIR